MDNLAAQEACNFSVVCVLCFFNQGLGGDVQKLLTGLPPKSVEKQRRRFPAGRAAATIGNFAHNPNHIKHLTQPSQSYAQACPPNLWIVHPDVDRRARNLAQCGSSAR